MRRWGRYILLLCLATVVLVWARPVRAQTEQDLQKQIDELTKQVVLLQGQANTLSNQIKQFDVQIRLTQLKIDETEERIKLLGGRIDQLEGSLDSLTKAFSTRVVETYKMARVGEPFLFLLSSKDLSEGFVKLAYLKKIQESDRDLLVRLQVAQNTYKTQKTESEILQEKLTTQKAELASQKAAKAQLLTVTRNDEKKYQQLLAQAKAQLAALRSFVLRQGGASILSNQTKCDSWGCYYNQRDAQWGRMGLGGSPYSVAEYGCLVTSVSMIASHYGKDIKPLNIASVPEAFVPGTGYLYHTFSVSGINVTLQPISKDQLDNRLGSGPVIAGLYGGPDHFIVILRKEGNSYIMHDPFLENGSSRPLTDKYNVSDITSLRLVSFN